MLIESVVAKTDANGVVQRNKDHEIKYKVNGTHSAYGDWLVGREGEDVEVTIQHKNANIAGKNISWTELHPAIKTDTPVKPATPAPAPYPFKSRDFEAEAAGKCRYGFLLEAYKKDLPLNQKLVDEINAWVGVAMTGELDESN